MRMAEPARSNPHDGTIITEGPNQMWGTGATATFTEEEGTVTIFAAIDHCSTDCVGSRLILVIRHAQGKCARRMRFSAARYSLRSNNS